MCALRLWLLSYKVNFRSHWKNNTTGMLMLLLHSLYRYFFLFKKNSPKTTTTTKPELAPFMSMKFRYFLAINIKVLLISVSKNQSIFGNHVTAAAAERL